MAASLGWKFYGSCINTTFKSGLIFLFSLSFRFPVFTSITPISVLVLLKLTNGSHYHPKVIVLSPIFIYVYLLSFLKGDGSNIHSFLLLNHSATWKMISKLSDYYLNDDYCSKLSTVNYFRKKLHLRCLIGFLIPCCWPKIIGRCM